MKKLSLLHLFVLLCFAASAQKKPNIVLILADDMGYSDIGCYGGEVHTPAIDQLAKEGIRYKQFYNAARCCPTRASLITGLWFGLKKQEMDLKSWLMRNWLFYLLPKKRFTNQ